MSEQSQRYHLNLGIGERGMLQGDTSGGMFNFESNILNQLLMNIAKGEEGPLINKPSLSLGFEGGDIHPSLENFFATLGTNVYPTSEEHRTDYEWDLGNKALQDWMITLGYRF